MARGEVQAFIKASRHPYYVYILYRPGGIPFYVGKGRGDRVFQHEREAIGPGKSYKLNIIRAVQQSGGAIEYAIGAFFADEPDAHQREIELIAQIGRHDLGHGPLANLTDGGEGTSNPSAESKLQHLKTLADPEAEGERGIANRFFKQLLTVQSVPIKPVSEFTAVSLSPHPLPRQPTRRMAAALAASAIANRLLLEDGCILPRRMTIDGVMFVVENGVGRSILQARLALLDPAPNPLDEQFRLSGDSVRYIVSEIGERLLLDAGVLMPEV